MSLKERIGSKSAALVRREPITLPQAGERVTVRGLMSGEALRIGGEKEDRKRALLTVALCTEDPETGKLIWMAHSQEDLDSIGALHIDDLTAIGDKCAELSGVGLTSNQLLGNSLGTQSSSTSSAPVSAESQPS